MIATEIEERVGNSPMDATTTQEPTETKRRRTRASWEAERERIEIPILKPNVPTETKEPLGNSRMVATVTQEPVQPQLEIFQYENELLKEDA